MSIGYFQIVGPEKPFRVPYHGGPNGNAAIEAERLLECGGRHKDCDYDQFHNGALVYQRRNGKIAEVA